MDSFPKRIQLELTAKCNFKCPFCYCVWHEFPELAAKSLDTEGWFRIIDRIAESGGNSITFTGGEPLLRKDILEIAGYARRVMPHGQLTLFTNGSLMTEELILKFKKLKVRLATSLEGLRTYREMTGTKRDFKRQLKLIAKATELKWPFAVSIVATSANLHELSDIVSAAALSGASHIQTGAVMAEGRCKAHPELMLSLDQWAKAKEELRKLPGVSIAFAEEMICTCRKQPEELLTRFAPEKPKECPAGKNFCAAGPDGRLRLCLHTVEEIVWPGN